MKKILILSAAILLLYGCSLTNKDQEVTKIYNGQFEHSDLKVPITDGELLSSFTEFFQAEDSHWEAGETYPFKYVCTNGKESIKAEIGTYQKPCEFKGEWEGCGTAISRTAIICGDKYVIQEFTPQLGPILYGPYDIKN